MAATLLCAGMKAAVPTIAFNATRYIGVQGLYLPVVTESFAERTFRTAGTISRLFVNVSANSINATRTLRGRKNRVNANLSVSIGSTATGDFSDTSNSDSVTAGDEYNWQFTSPGGGTTGTITIFAINAIFEATTGTTALWFSNNTTAKSAAATSYLIPSSGGGNATESSMTYKLRCDCTLKNLSIFVSANTWTGTTTLKSRVAGANGNLSLSIGTTLTGVFEDTSNTDVIVAPTDVSFALTLGAGSGSLTAQCAGVEIENSSSATLVDSVSSAGIQLTSTNTNIAQLNANLANDTTASTSKIQYNATLANLYTVVTANTTSNASTVTSRINGSNGTLSISVTAGTTGAFEDNVNSDGVSDGDALGYSFTAGNANALTITIIGCKVYIPDPATLGETTYSCNVSVEKTRARNLSVGSNPTLNMAVHTRRSINVEVA